MKVLALSAALAAAVLAPAAPAKEIPLRVGDAELTAEIAGTEKARRTGLMHRDSLGENRGMLFVFPRPGRHGMWMKNTRIPLSAAFIDERGVIINIARMRPHSTRLHRAERAAKYVLEVNRGWFAARGIGPGTRITTSAKLPRGR